jgi:hypothetical protein
MAIRLARAVEGWTHPGAAVALLDALDRLKVDLEAAYAAELEAMEARDRALADVAFLETSLSDVEAALRLLEPEHYA